jgi:hypothetical protein
MRIPPTEFRDGDTLEPWHLNLIFDFIRRWDKFDVSPPLSFDGSSDSPPSLSLLEPETLVPFQAGSGIAAATSLTSLGSATVTLLNDYQGGPDLTTSGARTATCYNIFTTAVGTGKNGWATWRGPYLYAVVWDC